MAYTFLNVQDRALDFNYGTADRTRMKSAINIAYRDLATRHKWTFLETSAAITTTATVATTSLAPTRFMEFGRLRPDSAITTTTPEYIPWNLYDSDSLYTRYSEQNMASGIPTQFSIYDGNIYWNPIPDQVYTYELFYWEYPVELSADGDVPAIPEPDRDVLVFGALKYLALRDNDLQRMQLYQDQYEGMLAKMWAQDKQRQRHSPRKIPLPKSYGNRYA